MQTYLAPPPPLFFPVTLSTPYLINMNIIRNIIKQFHLLDTHQIVTGMLRNPLHPCHYMVNELKVKKEKPHQRNPPMILTPLI